MLNEQCPISLLQRQEDRNLTDLIRGVDRNFTCLDVLLPLAPFTYQWNFFRESQSLEII